MFFPPERINGILVNYSITYSTEGAFDLPMTLMRFVGEESAPYSRLNVTLKDIKPYANYYIKVRFNNARGFSHICFFFWSKSCMMLEVCFIDLRET